LLPDHPPEAVQLVAFVEDQLNIADAPVLMLAGLALMDATGAFGAGGSPCGVEVLAAVSPPDEPPHAASAAVNTAHARPELAFAQWERTSAIRIGSILIVAHLSQDREPAERTEKMTVDDGIP
jgi:hypothetical protein